jgi:hypothetical protein
LVEQIGMKQDVAADAIERVFGPLERPLGSNETPSAH